MLNLEQDTMNVTDGFLYINNLLEEEVERVANFYSNGFTNNYIYLTTDGGQNTAMNFILDLINKNKNNTTLILNETVASNGLVLYIKAECKKEVKPNSYAIAHLSYFNMKITGYNMDGISSSEVKHLKNLNKELINMYESIGIDKKLINKMIKGEDVLIDYKFLKKYTDEYNRKNKKLL